MIERLKSLALLTLWSLCFGVGQTQAGLTARLERDRIAEGETVRLLVEADGQVSGTPDTSPLERDFDVLGVASGSRVNIVNGKVNARTSWTLTLSPKRGGTLTVPALALDGERSRPLTLRVSEAPVAAAPSADHPIFIETEVDRDDPYVQGMVRYTVRLFHRVKLAEGSLSEPEPDNALVRRIGEDRQYRVDRGGQNYRVIERRYAVFPQASGELVLTAPVLNARIPDRSSSQRSPFRDFFGRDPFDDPFFGGNPFGDVFAATRPVRVRGEAQVLRVRARPEHTSGFQWLPAESLTLVESWQPEDEELRVGDPVTRTVTVRARGLTGEQLPDLEPGDADGFKIYPDRAKAATRDLDLSVEGEKSRSIAFVPIRPGRFTLPPVRLAWWDTQSGEERLAELPGRVVEILPALYAQGTSEPRSSVRDTPGEDVPSRSLGEAGVISPGADTASAAVGAVVPGLPVAPGLWPWVSGFFALLWIVTLGFWWRFRRFSPDAAQSTAVGARTAREDIPKAKQRFFAACRANDPRLARRSLLDWAAAQWPDEPPSGLDDLARRLNDPQVRELLLDLDRVLYRGREKAWSGRALAALLSDLPQRVTHDEDRKMPLPDLYA